MCPPSPRKQSQPFSSARSRKSRKTKPELCRKRRLISSLHTAPAIVAPLPGMQVEESCARQPRWRRRVAEARRYKERISHESLQFGEGSTDLSSEASSERGSLMSSLANAGRSELSGNDP